MVLIPGVPKTGPRPSVPHPEAVGSQQVASYICFSVTHLVADLSVPVWRASAGCGICRRHRGRVYRSVFLRRARIDRATEPWGAATAVAAVGMVGADSKKAKAAV